MKMKIALSMVAAAVAMLSQGAFAQASAPDGKSRADVKAEAKAAVKAGDTKAGEGKPNAPAPKGEKARADVKAEAKKAEKEGTVMKAGEGTNASDKAKGEKARADVKAETKKAVKEGTTLPAGEAAPKK